MSPEKIDIINHFNKLISLLPLVPPTETLLNPNQAKSYSGKNLSVYLLNGQYYSQGEIYKGLRHGTGVSGLKMVREKSEKNYKVGVCISGEC